MSRIEPLPMRLRAPVQGFPKGWYRVADAGEVLPDALLPVSWLNDQYIVFRGADGRAQVADAFCPHMGAHLASHDGCLRHGRIVCPFHKWEFDAASAPWRTSLLRAAAGRRRTEKCTPHASSMAWC